jgi:hypothetical protein
MEDLLAWDIEQATKLTSIVRDPAFASACPDMCHPLDRRQLADTAFARARMALS